MSLLIVVAKAGLSSTSGLSIYLACLSGTACRLRARTKPRTAHSCACDGDSVIWSVFNQMSDTDSATRSRRHCLPDRVCYEDRKLARRERNERRDAPDQHRTKISCFSNRASSKHTIASNTVAKLLRAPFPICTDILPNSTR